MAVKVLKMDGTKEDYSEEKIRSSASRVGVPANLTEEMLAHIRSRLYEGMTTQEIFAIIKEYLTSSPNPHLAAKYDLKKALAELGPSGYPFEQYVGHLLHEEGYQIQTNQTLMGKCVSHEVDVLAVKDGYKYYIEAKFHSSPNQRTDVRVPLYIRARYEDLASRDPSQSQAWIFTNTRFSSDAIAYANCVGIRLTSWGYPSGEGIMDLIERTHYFPITILTGLTNEDKKLLLSQDIVVCRQLVDDPRAAELIPKSKRSAVVQQAKLLCKN